MTEILSLLTFWMVVLALAAATLVPLGAAIVAIVKFRRMDCPPWSLPLGLGGAALGTAIYLVCVPGIPLFMSLPTIAGFILCLVLAIAFTLRRVRGLPFSGAAMSATVSVLVALICFDLRFRVEVQDPIGKAVAIRGDSIDLRRPPEGFLQSYEYGKGVRLRKGTIYFGFIQWLRHKESWTFSGSFDGAAGHYRGDLEWKPAGWSEWPKIVVMQPQLPSW